jgi:GDP/UDP-N,N'-diacetylbacillosamine 2-epimerase (hydrolysing)
MKKICVVTGSRADYGLLRWVMENIRKSKILDLQLVVTGTHLTEDFGLTVREITEDGFHIAKTVEMLLNSDTDVGTAKSIGLGIISFADIFEDLRPDFLLVLGDRYEILAAAVAAMVRKIPIGHISGGESTEGAIDEAIRHSITKMSHLHFVATEGYRLRVIQLGEDPSRVFNVGGLGVDAIRHLKLLSRDALEARLGVKLLQRNLLVTFHPVTLEVNTAEYQIKQLLEALNMLDQTRFIFTMPNADPNGKIVLREIEEFCSKNENARLYPSLGQSLYFSCLRQMDGVIGNSSSGISEAPSFNIGTINIGDRQRGRTKAESVIDCEPSSEEISSALHKLFSDAFRLTLKAAKNPYGVGGASETIVRILETQNKSLSLKKKFFDFSPVQL